MTIALRYPLAALAAAATFMIPSARPVNARPMGGPPDTLVANARASTVRWSDARAGRAATGGSAPLASGMLVIRHEMLVSGVFTVATKPAATTFTSKGAERIGPARWRVNGELATNGVVRPVTFDADVQWAGIGHMVATTAFTLDDTTRVSVKIDALRRNPRIASRFGMPSLSLF